MKQKILSLLVLLLTAASGAWAQDPVAKDIVVSPESGTNISDAIKDALGTNGDWALNITINLAKGGTYTVTESIVPSASITINGNGATIDASGLTTYFIMMRRTPSYDKVESGEYVVTTPSKIENVTITGLTKALFYDNGRPYVFEDFTFNNCLINYSEQMNLIISLSASMVINFTITNSTFYCPDKTSSSANCIAMSGKRPWQVTGFEDKEGKLLVDHNTFYNVAYKKQFFNTNTLKGQTKYKYEFNSNIFVNVSNMKIYGNLTNNKNQVTTDGLNTYIWDDTFFSETNYNGDEGLKSDPLFKDAANGDFTLDRSSLQYKNNTGDPLWFNPKVTINDNQTEASFEMPTSDVTAEYELVRDMEDATYPVEFAGIPEPTTTGGVSKIVVKKNSTSGKFEFLNPMTIQLIDNISGTDVDIMKAEGITIKVVKDEGSDGNFSFSDTNAITLDEFLTDTQPGYYELMAMPTDETSPYIGLVISNVMELCAKSDLTLTAGSDFTIDGSKATLTVDGTDKSAAIAEGKLADVDMNANVSIAANDGYVMTALSVTCGEQNVDVTTADGVSSFTMPEAPATVAYTLTRDMSVKVTTQIAERVRIQKKEGKFDAVDPFELIPILTDKIGSTDKKMFLGEETGTSGDFYIKGIQKLDGEDWVDATELGVGTYRLVIAGKGNYDGTIYTAAIELYQGYEVTIPAGEFITYFKDENLKVEDAAAELYTIKSVTATEAVLSDKLEVVAAETPMLVYNKGEETKTFLLIPTEDQADEVTAADEFKGTLEAKDMPASSASTNYYGCTGKAFVWLKSAGKIAANRCWLEISTSEPNSARKIVSGNATGIDSMVNGQWSMDNYYDMQGRKVEKPVRGGIYIKNGKKVIVK